MPARQDSVHTRDNHVSVIIDNIVVCLDVIKSERAADLYIYIYIYIYIIYIYILYI